MRQSSRIAGHMSPVSGQLSERVGRFLRRRHPFKTAERVAAEVPGVTADQVAKWLSRASAPGPVAMILLIHAYGPEFLADVMDTPPSWVNAAAREARQRQLEAQLQHLQAELKRI